MVHQNLKAGRYFIPGLFLALIVLALDQYSKWFMLEQFLRLEGEMLPFKDWFFRRDPISYFLTEREKFKTIEVAPFFNLVMVWNPGISFGMLGKSGNANIMSMILVATSLLISLFLVIWLALSRRKMHSLAIGLIVGGALGNVIDRVRFGAVADFLDFHWKDLHWPAFNVADSCIVVGALFLILDMIMTPKETAKL